MNKRTRNLFSLLCILAIITVNSISVFANEYTAQTRLSSSLVMSVGSNKAFLNNTQTYIDTSNHEVKPIINQGRTLVPVRFITESFGLNVGWNDETRTVTLKNSDFDIKLTIGEKNIVINNVVNAMDVPAQIINNRTFVPLRAIAEAIGKEVFYDRGLIIISDIHNIIDIEEESYLVDYILRKFNNTLDVEMLSRSVVLLTCYNVVDDEISTGSGFFVEPGLIVTNEHVIRGAHKIIVELDNGDKIQGVSITSNLNLDLALIKVPIVSDIKPLQLGSYSDLKRGMDVISIGSPQGFKNTISKGIISGLRVENNIKYIQNTSSISSGSSGGPLIDDSGKVIGINTMGIHEGNLFFSISSDHLKDWIQNVKETDYMELGVVNNSLLSYENVRQFMYEFLQSVEDRNITQYVGMLLEFNEYTIYRAYALFEAIDDLNPKLTLESVNILDTEENIGAAHIEYMYYLQLENNYNEIFTSKVKGEGILFATATGLKVYGAYEEVIQTENNILHSIN